MAKQIASINSKPGSWIVSPKDRGRKQIKSGKVFLKDGEEFEVELFNPLTVSVLADIKLNGQSISKTGLVVKPGQRVYLDCFIDDRKKFKFSTYEIENSGEALDATQNNGLLEVFFYKEDVITLDNWQRKFDRIVERWYPYQRPYYYPSYPKPYEVYYGCGNGSGIIGTTTNVYNSLDCNYNSQVDLSNLNVTGSLSDKLTPISTNYIETGRVEKGKKSKQKFTEVDMDFEKHYIASTIIQILPESRKPAEVKEVFNKKTGEIKFKKEAEDVIELIKKLADLHSAGILTDEEFSSKKVELLSKI